MNNSPTKLANLTHIDNLSTKPTCPIIASKTEECLKSMEDEINSFIRNRIWELVSRTPNIMSLIQDSFGG